MAKYFNACFCVFPPIHSCKFYSNKFTNSSLFPSQKKTCFLHISFQSFQCSNQNNVFAAVHMHQSYMMLTQITHYFHNMDFLATSAKTTSHEEVIENGLLITSSSLIWSLLFDKGIVRAIPKFPIIDIIVFDIIPCFPSTKKFCWVVQICFLDPILT